MEHEKKKRKAPLRAVRDAQASVQITLTWKEAASLVAYDLVEPEDFAEQVIEMAATELDALSLLTEELDTDDFVRLLQCLRTRLVLAVQLNSLLTTALRKRENGLQADTKEKGQGADHA